MPSVTGIKLFTRKLNHVSPSAVIPYSDAVNNPATPKYISAMQCSNPHNTNIITGQKLVINFPDTLFAANDIQIAIHTNILHNIPLTKLSETAKSVLAFAAFTIAPAKSP